MPEADPERKPACTRQAMVIEFEEVRVCGSPLSERAILRATMRRRAFFSNSTLLLAVSLATCAPLLAQSPEKPTSASESPGGSLPKYLEVSAGTTIPVTLAHTLTTKTARVGDFVVFKTMSPVFSQERQLAIPAESVIRGTVVGVKRPGRVKGRAELRIHLERLSLPNGYTMELNASLEPPGPDHPGDGEGGTIAGEPGKAHDAITVATFSGQGAMLGGVAGQSAKDAAVGAGAGALAGLIGVLLSRGPEIRLEPGTPFRISLSRLLRVDLEELRAMPEVLRPINDGAPRIKHNPPSATSSDKP